MKTTFRIILSVLFTMLCIHAPAQAVNTSLTLRVGLYYSSTALSSATLESTNGFSAGTVSGTEFLSQQPISANQIIVTGNGTSLTVKNAAGAVLYTAAGDQLALRAADGLTKLKEYSYHGDFVLQQSSSGALTIINYVGLEDYVKGVLPHEMSASWPLEALKAQAICTRSYALGNLNKHKAYGFDLCSTTNCQVYRGISRANANSDAAADSTAGQHLTYNNQPVVGFFFSSDGGATEDNENVWGGAALPYLRGVQDPYEKTDTISNGVWKVTLTPAQVATKLRSAGHNIGTVTSVQVTKRTAADNVNVVTVTDASGKSVQIKNSAVRTVFGLNSIRYTVSSANAAGGSLFINGAARADGGYYAIGASGKPQSIGSVSGKTALTATGKQTVTTAGSAASAFTFSGHGWGHHVGMSQNGARAMADQGFTYDQILKFYFTGIKITG